MLEILGLRGRVRGQGGGTGLRVRVGSQGSGSGFKVRVEGQGLGSELRVEGLGCTHLRRQSCLSQP